MKVIEMVLSNAKLATGAGKALVFAGLGTYSLLEENSKKLVDTLIQKGEMYKGPKPIKAPAQLSSITDSLKDRGQQVEKKVQTVINGALSRFGVPSRDEVYTLISRVESLAKKIDGMKV
ncbi:MAG: hypothetical protein CR997_07415 [Acidobacteria bacterium]|nr:MAG: hypothetical protein CR997_07415 [Acidobacteriota bacterium]